MTAITSPLAAYARAGNHLILEHILEGEGWFDELVTLFAPFDVLFIGLHCPPDVLEAREEARGDRPIGSALADYHNIHKSLRYDLELDALDPLADNVEKVIATWQEQMTRGGNRPSVFKQKWADLNSALRE
ncbi:hypothetical protein [uncultured Cohaesibacter sp.]|uniref:phosphotransferase-like protein n=1 Tax=uncultured Cohaesibacter sp. TaxID=1002546 RepID=UPI0029C62BB4|nr:hypothetical protein [uncultured Cohaesibacter sp.]